MAEDILDYANWSVAPHSDGGLNQYKDDDVVWTWWNYKWPQHFCVHVWMSLLHTASQTGQNNCLQVCFYVLLL